LAEVEGSMYLLAIIMTFFQAGERLIEDDSFDTVSCLKVEVASNKYDSLGKRISLDSADVFYNCNGYLLGARRSDLLPLAMIQRECKSTVSLAYRCIADDVLGLIKKGGIIAVPSKRHEILIQKLFVNLAWRNIIFIRRVGDERKLDFQVAFRSDEFGYPKRIPRIQVMSVLPSWHDDPIELFRTFLCWVPVDSTPSF